MHMPSLFKTGQVVLDTDSLKNFLNVIYTCISPLDNGVVLQLNNIELSFLSDVLSRIWFWLNWPKGSSKADI